MAFLLFKANPNRGTLDSILLSQQGFTSSPLGGSPSTRPCLLAPRPGQHAQVPPLFRQTSSTPFGLSSPHTSKASLLKVPDSPLRLPAYSPLAGQLWSPVIQCPASEPHQPHPLSLVTFQSLGLYNWPSALLPAPGAKGIVTLDPGNHSDPRPGQPSMVPLFPLPGVVPPRLDRINQDTKH